MGRISDTDLEVHPFALGGNVFGWTADRDGSFAVLDAYTEGGGNFVDTADVYSAWVEGNSGGESETVIGEWLASRRNRDDVVITTKAGGHPRFRGLRADTIKRAAEESLRRLGTDRIDLYYAHFDDPETPVAETLGALDQLVHEGKVRYIAASNFTAARLAESLAHSEAEGIARYVAFQPHYNLVSRDTYEGELAETVQANGLSALPYYALASGFLTGKYRPGQKVDSARAGKAGEYLASERGQRVLTALDQVAGEQDTEVATVALAWLTSKPTVVAPIASARTVDQLGPLLAVADVHLTPGQIALLDDASA
ncbi:aldo/keto reductase [Spirillospora sp. NPDC048911]|uniref:aldo/keto reductase n=1 Tax=Spirillospora sp. NPDC048911 TaxID=3364527 RepID=UPI00371B36C6